MTAFTSKASGNWSASGTTTWVQAGTPGAGDTVTIGNHTITMDVDVTLGTSPNNNTSMVLTVGAGSLILAAGRTLTLRGNATDSFSTTITLNAGAAIVFDNALSGGSPVYVWSSAFTPWAINGTSGSRCSISAIAGQTFVFTITNLFPTFTATYCDVTRMAGSVWTIHGSAATSFSLTHCTFTSCGQLNVSSSATTCNFNIDNNTFTSGTDGGGVDLSNNISGTFTSGTRSFTGNALDGNLTYFGDGFSGSFNVIGSVSGAKTSGSWATFTDSVITDGNNIVGRVGTISRCYFLKSGDNPHFLSIPAHDRNSTVSNCIFESRTSYETDNGDCIFPYCVSPFKVTVSNNIVIANPDGYDSGTLATHYSSAAFSGSFDDAARTVEYLHNTVLVYSPNDANQAAIDTAEAQFGHAGEVTLFKSNLIWSPVSGRALKFSRQTGTVAGILTASGADYNGSWNLRAGDNGLGYEDTSGSLDLWTGAAASGGNAAAQSIDAHGVTANPQFVDPRRNLAAWAVSRGYGVTTADAIAALKADTTRITDAIDYVAAGYAPQNVSLWHAGHDGATVGAVELTARYGAAARSLILTQGVLCG